ncbi:MAG TPA: enoyl-CoA hydratase-related protein, partial [Vicinamibacteria bacterium]|nr:enoyl-CoA hydratase-related protein [Vicinamibacteria bacterium]
MDDILDPILAAREPRKIENVQYLLDDGVARIRFKRPEAANALNLAVLEDLIHALEQLELK